MAIDDIKKAILAEAKQSAQSIIAEADQKVSDIKAEWTQKLELKKSELLKSAQLKTDKKIQQSQFKIQAQNQTIILAEKQKIIDKVYKTALQKLNGLDDTKYIELMEKFISNISIDGELTSAKDKENLLKKATKKSKVNLQISKDTINVGGGFIFRASSMEIDFTFPTLINNSKEQSILAISQMLFADKENVE